LNKHERIRQEAKDDAASRVARADRFERFLEEEGFGAVIEQWERELVEALVGCKVSQDKERYRFAVSIEMLRRFRGWLNQAVTEGKMNKKLLAEIEGNPGWRPFH